MDIDKIARHRLTKVRIRIAIPAEYHELPIISRLVSHHGVMVNIATASLESSKSLEGWFDLELSGSTPQVQSALTYLDELDVPIYPQPQPEYDGW